jgi:hypothetical protein
MPNAKRQTTTSSGAAVNMVCGIGPETDFKKEWDEGTMDETMLFVLHISCKQEECIADSRPEKVTGLIQKTRNCSMFRYFFAADIFPLK